MDKKGTKIIVSIIGIFMIAIIVYSFTRNNDSLPINNIWSKSNVTGESNEQVKKESSSIKNKPLDMNNEISTDGMTYKINSITRTKDKGLLPLTSFYNDILDLDNKGTILNEYSYLIVNLSIQNNLEQVKEISLNSYYIVGGNMEGGRAELFEPMLFDKRADVEKRDYFHYILQPNEKVTFNLGFIKKDAILDKYKEQLNFVINNGYTNEILVDKNVRIIKIKY
ncbi:hypothetical protein [Bacillus tuaregi]|uniref:hypothetical protein n=1 Tax=Bacillus tuaregi TaxID=1816695 RepID=UPI0008F94270|nr:hypothetical protein [Bacillus tuaregi]